MAETAVDRVRWGLVGAGDIAAKRVAPALVEIPRSSLVSVGRRNAGRAEEFARRFGADRYFTDWASLVQDDEVDAIYVATPVDSHADITVAAAEAGKHVLCEKPMAMTVAECDRMIAAADANGVLLGVAYYRHFYPIVTRLKELLLRGAIGRPVVAQINAFERFDPPSDHPRAWLLDPTLSGGGPMFDFGCHRIEVLTHLLGECVAVTGAMSKTVFDRPVEDTGAVILTFESGAIGMVTVSHAANEPQDTLQIFGEEGSIEVPVLNTGGLTLRLGTERSIERHDPPANLHLPLIEQFVDAILSGGQPVVDGRVGREVNRLLELAYGAPNGAPPR